MDVDATPRTQRHAWTDGDGVRRVGWTCADSENGWTVERVLKERLGASDIGVRRAKAVGANDIPFLEYGCEQFYDIGSALAAHPEFAGAEASGIAGITVNGRRARTCARVAAGCEVAMVIDDEHLGIITDKIEPAPGPLDIAYEDDDLLIVDKRPGVVMYPGNWQRTDCTLANFVGHHLREQGLACNVHPVHRLDKETSGLVAFTKNSYAHARLQQALHTGDFERTYLALCTGTMETGAGVVDAPIARLGYSPSVFAIHESGKRAVTRWRLVRTLDSAEGPLGLVELRLETGRSHQIRIHMQSLGHPLLGDTAYGTASGIIGRTALHSWRMSVRHPVTGEPLSLEAPLPADFPVPAAPVPGNREN